MAAPMLETPACSTRTDTRCDLRIACLMAIVCDENDGDDGAVLYTTAFPGVGAIILGRHRCVRDRRCPPGVDRAQAKQIARPPHRPHPWCANCRDIRLDSDLLADPTYHRPVGTAAPDRSVD